jgi:hypothetical protein
MSFIIRKEQGFNSQIRRFPFVGTVVRSSTIMGERECKRTRRKGRGFRPTSAIRFRMILVEPRSLLISSSYLNIWSSCPSKNQAAHCKNSRSREPLEVRRERYNLPGEQELRVVVCLISRPLKSFRLRGSWGKFETFFVRCYSRAI